MLSAANTFTGGVQQITTASAATVGLIVRGTASQTAFLQSWQDSAGTILTNITAAGGIETNGGMRFYTSSARSGWSTLTNTSGNLSFNYQFALTDRFTVTAGAAATVPMTVKGAASQTGNLTEWQNSAGTILLRVDSAGNLLAPTSSATAIRFRYFDGTGATGTYIDTALVTNSLVMVGRSSTAVSVIVRSAASQTANLQEWQNSGGTILTAVNASGTINFASGNTSATANTGAVSLPAQAVGFITMQVAGTTVKVPYYAN